MWTKACRQQGSETQGCRWPRLENRQETQITVFKAPLLHRKVRKEVANGGEWAGLFSCAGEPVVHLEWAACVWSWKQEPEEGQAHPAWEQQRESGNKHTWKTNIQLICPLKKRWAHTWPHVHVPKTIPLATATRLQPLWRWRGEICCPYKKVWSTASVNDI